MANQNPEWGTIFCSPGHSAKVWLLPDGGRRIRGGAERRHSGSERNIPTTTQLILHHLGVSGNCDEMGGNIFLLNISYCSICHTHGFREAVAMEDATFLCLTSAKVGETIEDSLVVARVLEYCLQRRVTNLHSLSRAFQLLVRQVSFGWKMNVMVCLACRKMVLQVEEYNLLFVAGYNEGHLKYATSSGQRCQAPRLTLLATTMEAHPDPLKRASFLHKCGAHEFLLFPKLEGSNLLQFGISGLHSSPTCQSPAPQQKSLPILWHKHRS